MFVEAVLPVFGIPEDVNVVNEGNDAEDQHEEGKNAHSNYIRADFAAGVFRDYFPALDSNSYQQDQT